jgi:pimeloyl-ACP methyl ester carboxylesterase
VRPRTSSQRRARLTPSGEGAGAIHWLRKIAVTFGALVILLALAGASYQLIESRLDARHFPENGRLIDVGGYSLLLNCTGTGRPTVILESGLGDLSVEWRAVQPEVAKFSRVCSYDRAGYGSSDPGPMPRTSAQIAAELHILLKNAGEVPPYVLVGHSFGGYNVRVFNGRYPDEVAGIVLVDATQEDQYELLPKAWKAISSAQLEHYERQARYAWPFINLGIARLMLLQAHGLNQYSYLILQAKYLRARASELEEIQVSAEQTRASGNISEKALLILTATEKSDAILSSGFSKQEYGIFNGPGWLTCKYDWRASPLAESVSSYQTADTTFLRIVLIPLCKRYSRFAQRQ